MEDSDGQSETYLHCRNVSHFVYDTLTMRRADLGSTKKVEGVHLVAYQGKQIDAGRVGRLVGTYGVQIGCTSHDVYDVPVTALHEFVQQRIPNTIASDPCGRVLRLYVPKSKRGQISDIGIINGVYKAPGRPYVPRNGPIYSAPADPPNVRAVAPARPEGLLYNPWTDSDGWQPGPGDRFKVTEIA